MLVSNSIFGFKLKLFAIIILLFVIPINAQIRQNSSLSIRLVEVSLEQALKSIEQKSDFTFSYIKEELPLKERVTLIAENEPIQQILDKLNKKYGLIFSQINNIIVVKSSAKLNKIKYDVGSLCGIVIDSSNNEVLMGANIILKGTSIGAATNFEGKYKICSIPVGNYKIKVSTVGYKSKEYQVSIKSNQTTILNSELLDDVIHSDEVVITSQALGQNAAIRQQINSVTPVNVVSSDRIKELPDANAAESIGRLPGISLIRSAGEASKVVIRGLEPKFNAITINNVRIPSTAYDDRSVDLSMISTDMLSSIEVYKAITPDMDAEAVGGVVNLKIKRAPSEQRLQLKLEPGYSQLKDDWGNYNFTSEYSNRFFMDKLGIMFLISYQKINRSSESFNAEYQITGLRDPVTGIVSTAGKDLGLKNIDEQRKRSTASLILDYSFGEKGTMWLTNFYSSTTRNPFSINKSYHGMGDKIYYTANDQDIEETGLLNSINGELHVLNSDMDWVLSRYNVLSNVNYSATMNFMQGSSFNNSLLDVNNLSTYIPASKDSLGMIFLSGSSYEPSQTYQTNYAANYNLKKEFKLREDISAFIKSGIKYLKSDRSNNQYRWAEDQYSISDAAHLIKLAESNWPVPLTKDNLGRILAINFISSPTASEKILDGEYNLFPLFDRNSLRQWTSSQKNNYNYDRTGLINDYNLTETVSAAYLMGQLKFNNSFTLMGGARYEYSNNHYQSVWTTAYEIYGRSGIVKDTTTAKKYGYWYPGIYLKYRPLDWLNILASANKTIARPDYSMIEPYTRYDQTNAVLYRGNPGLKESMTWNYNVTLSLYNCTYGLFSISGFYKDVRNLFYPKTSQIYQQEDIDALGIPGKEGGYLMYSFGNSSKANVRGIEIELQTHFNLLSNIPNILRGLVLSTNYSRIWSETYFPIGYNLIPIPIPGTRPPKFTFDYTEKYRKGPMPGQANQIANISLGYDIGGLLARLTLLYQGASLSSIGTIEENDFWNDAFWRWDFTIKFHLNKIINLTFNLVNITNQPDKAYFGSKNYISSIYHYGLNSNAGIELNF